MTEHPEREETSGGLPSDPVPGAIPPRPEYAPQADPGREVLSAGGPEPGRPSGAALRGLWQRRSARARAVIAAAAVAALTLGGTVAYAATSDRSGDEPTAAGASPSASPSPDGSDGGHGHRSWFRFGGGVHGESTVKDRDTGEWVVRIWQRGTIQKVDGDQVTVRSEDGAEWTWTVNADTKVHHDGTSGTGTDALKQGETAFLAGTRSGADRTAKRVVAGAFEGKGEGRGWFRDHGPRDGRGWKDRAPSPGPSAGGTTA